MCYYFIIELIPDRCEHGEISKRQDLWSWICNKFLKTVKTTVLGWFFDKTERERAKEESALEGNILSA